jgi:hypothetical protein
MEYTDNTSRNSGLIGTIAFHAVLILILLFAVLTLPFPRLSDPEKHQGFLSINFESNQGTTANACGVKTSDLPEVKNGQNFKPLENQTPVITGNDVMNISAVETNRRTIPSSNTPTTQLANNSNPQNLYNTPANSSTGITAGDENLSISGWTWDSEPVINDNSDESGRIVIGFRIDAQGTVIKVWKMENNLSPSVYKIYEDAVKVLTFSRKGDNTTPTAYADGKVTFVKKSK